MASAVEAGRLSKLLIEEKRRPSQMTVLLEEIGELADAIGQGHSPRDELIQVAAMAYAMLVHLEATDEG